MSAQRGPIRMLVFAALFVGLAAAGVAWAVSHVDLTLSELVRLGRFGPAGIGLLVGLAIGLYAADVLRYRAIGHALGAPVDNRAALDASVANFFFSWLTPGSAFGAPATIYMLRRRGLSWDAAVLIAFAKSLTGIGFLVLCTAGVMVLGWAPRFHRSIMLVAVPGVLMIAAGLGALLVAGLLATPASRGITRLEQWLLARKLGRGPRMGRAIGSTCRHLCGAVERLGKLGTGGRGVLLVVASHALYFGVFAAIAVVLALGFGATSVIRSVGAATTFLAFSYLAPSPGGAGTEAAAVPFFGDLFAPASAVAVVLLFRVLTFYLQIGVGLVYLLAVGGLGQIARREAADADH